MAQEWALAGVGLLGIVVGAMVSLATDLIKSRRDDGAEQRRWRRDRAMAAVEEALALVSAVRTESHGEHEDWATRLAATNLLIRLYCGSNVQGAFSAIKDSLLLVAKNPDLAHEKVMLTLGEATAYLEVTARFDLDIDGTEDEVQAGKDRFLRSLAELRP